MANEHEMYPVTVSTWRDRGHRDGLHGNVRFPPRKGYDAHGDYEASRTAYLAGYEQGVREWDARSKQS